MGEKVQVKLVEISERIISIQDINATFCEHLITIDASKLEHYKQIQRDFQRMQSELLDLIEENK